MYASDLSSTPSLVRRCRHLLLEAREQNELDLHALLGDGRTALLPVRRWVALAAHLDAEVALEQPLVDALSSCPVEQWTDAGALAASIGETALQALLKLGVVIGNHAQHDALRERDASAREVPWAGLAAVAHAHSRWQGVDSLAWQQTRGLADTAAMVREYGAPPAEQPRRVPEASPVVLPAATHGPLDERLAARYTCRNFLRDAAISLSELATLLHRIAGVVDSQALAEQAVALKKYAPAGGGLHATETYVLVRCVEGMPTGVHHYLCVDHQLECLREMTPEATADCALQVVAGQRWFADAAVLIVLTTRFDRLFWKYRRHAKALRVSLLDAGHLSMLGYLAAGDLGLGAFVTAAVNDHEVEALLQLDPLREGVACVLGFGRPLPGGQHPEWRCQPPPQASADRGSLRPDAGSGDDASPSTGE